MNYLWRAIGSNGYLNIGRSLVFHELSVCSVRQKGAPLARLTAFILFLGSSESWLPLSRKKKSAPIVGAPDYVSAKLQGRNAAITVTAMNGYAQTG